MTTCAREAAGIVPAVIAGLTAPKTGCHWAHGEPINVDITCSTSYPVVMAKRNLTIQLDEATIRHAKIVAAHRGISLSGLVAQQLNELAAADDRYERARAVALEALAGATGGGTPAWHREELYDL
jgi:hypothetical protein